MKQYIVYYGAGGVDYVLAYGYELKHGKAVFDVGTRRRLTLTDVTRVELLGDSQ